jgi:mycothiol system anti-sigma-R factor
MECQRVREAMYRVTENELDAELIPPFREHLTLCPPCDHHFAYVAKLLEVVRCRCSRYSAPSTLRIRILASFPHRDGVVLEPVE